jgi:hypothetical protein
MILRITVNDNDFTEYLEQFAEDIELFDYTRKLTTDNMSIDALYEHIKSKERFRELFYNTEKYTPEFAKELCDMIRKYWEIWVTSCLKLEEWQDDDTREYLIKEFKVKFQKSLTPKWENGEVVYICCGYPNRWWTF